MSIVSLRIPQSLKDRLTGAASHFPGDKGLGTLMRRAMELGLDNLDAEGRSVSDPVTTLASIYTKMGCEQTPTAPQWKLFGTLLHEAFLHTTKSKFVPRVTVDAIASVTTAIYDAISGPEGLDYDGYLLDKLGDRRDANVPAAVTTFMGQIGPHPDIHMAEVFSRVLVRLLDDPSAADHLPALRGAFSKVFVQLYPVAVRGLRLIHKGPQSALDAILPGGGQSPLPGFTSHTSRNRDGVWVNVTIFDKHSWGLVTTLPAPTDLRMSFNDPFELLAVLESIQGEGRSTLAGLPDVVDGDGYSLVRMPGVKDKVHFSRGFLQMQLPVEVVATWRELLADAVRDPEFVAAYARWRMFAGSL